jgi:hypothetical protein
MNGFRANRDHWDFTASGIIWKILPCEGRLIIGEERDPARKTMSLFCVRLDDGSVVWKGLTPGDNWWTGIEVVHRGVIIAHEYPVPSMPDHGSIIAIDAARGERLWENRDLAFAFASGGTICGSKDLFDRRAFFEVDPATGASGRELTANEARSLRDSGEAGWGMDVGIPVPSGEVPDHVRASFPPSTGLLPGEILMHNDTEISNCYESRPAGALREHIFAFDARTGSLLRRDVVCDGLSVPAGTTFFRAEGRILYVRDRSTLRSFALPEGGPA